MQLQDLFPAAKIVVGNSELGVEMRAKKCIYPVMLHPVYVPEVNSIELTDDKQSVTIGSAVTLTHLEDFIRKVTKEKYKVFEALRGNLA